MAMLLGFVYFDFLSPFPVNTCFVSSPVLSWPCFTGPPGNGHFPGINFVLFLFPSELRDRSSLECQPLDLSSKRERLWPNVGLLLGQHRRRWPNIKTTLGQQLVVPALVGNICTTPSRNVTIRKKTKYKRVFYQKTLQNWWNITLIIIHQCLSN